MADAKTRAKELLRATSVFAGCPDGVLHDIAQRGSVVRHAKGAEIYRQGSPGDSLMVLLSGSLKIFNVTGDAREVVLRFAKPGALIGELAVLDGGLRSASVVALEPSEAFIIYRRDLLPILRASGEAMSALVSGLCTIIRANNARMESYGMQTSARGAACLVQLAAQHGTRSADGSVVIDLKITQRDLGNYLGLTRETVSRLLGEFRDARLVELRAGSIVIVDVEGLQDLADATRA